MDESRLEWSYCSPSTIPESRDTSSRGSGEMEESRSESGSGSSEGSMESSKGGKEDGDKED